MLYSRVHHPNVAAGKGATDLKVKTRVLLHITDIKTHFF